MTAARAEDRGSTTAPAVTTMAVEAAAAMLKAVGSNRCAIGSMQLL